MPYIVTTTTTRECICTDADDPNDHRKDCPSWYGSEAFTRHAVATLDEARDVIFAPDHGIMAYSRAEVDFAEQVHALPESGGTVGPLPDGTVIEVAETTLSNLADDCDFDPVDLERLDDAAADVIDAYNAAQESDR